MRVRGVSFLIGTVLLLSVTPAPGSLGLSLPLQFAADLPLPGNPTRLDYQSLDSKRHLLFIAHLGDSNVIVVDTNSRRVLATVPDVSRVHGVLVVPDLHRVYASATGTNEVVAIDESTFKIIARSSGGVYPDGMAYDPTTHHVFVSDEHGKTETVIDTKSNQTIATIGLGGEVGNTQYDSVSRHMFVNVQTLGQLLEINPATNAVVERTSLPGCAGNHGLLIDSLRRRAFIACEDNATLLWLDMKTMRVVQSWSIGANPDVIALDPHKEWLYIAAESGVVSIFSGGRQVMRVAQNFLAPAAHTVAVNPGTHLVYFPLENVRGRPVLRILAPR